MCKDGITACDVCGEDFCRNCADFDGECSECGITLCDDCHREYNGLCKTCKGIQNEEKEDMKVEIAILIVKNEICTTCDFKLKDLRDFPCMVCSAGPKEGIINHYRKEVKLVSSNV